MGRMFFAVIIVGGLVLSSVSFGYSGGLGTAEEPYQIADANDLLEMAGTTADYNKCFIMTEDINLGGQVFTTAIIAADTNAISGFQGTAFTGTFDGNGHIIRNAVINQPGSGNVGLFGYVSSGGQIRNLGVENVNMTGSQYVGGLVGENYGSTSHCYATGAVSGYRGVGGLVGLNSSNGNISNCYATGAVSASGTGSGDVGGLVGYSDGSISDCYSMGAVRGTYYDVGGLAGSNDGSISNCYSTGSVSGSLYVGGLVGVNSGSISGSISNCYSTGPVSGYWDVGGLVGENDGSISNCFSTGTVTGGDYSYCLGGLVGADYQESNISNCYSTGNVTGGDHSNHLGGLVGYSDGNISNCYATGAVSGASNVGGLAGWNESGSVVSSFWDVNTSGWMTSDGGEGKTTTEMQTRSTFTNAGWDFVDETANGIDDIWRMCIDGVNYPLLWWQFNTADFTCPDGVDFIDFAILANAWLSNPTQVNWNPRCDIAEPPDNVIDTLDLAIFAENWLEGVTP